MRTRDIERIARLRKSFDAVMAYFQVSQESQILAWDAALRDREKAGRCYAAIAGSIK